MPSASTSKPFDFELARKCTKRGACGCGLAPLRPTVWQRAQLAVSNASPRRVGVLASGPRAADSEQAEEQPAEHCAGVGAGRRQTRSDLRRHDPHGRSLKGAAAAYRDAGAAAIDAIETHGLFQGDALDKLRVSGLFGAIVTTDSHPRSIALAGDEFLQVESTAALLVEHLILMVR
jgi:hypothetical protein